MNYRNRSFFALNPLTLALTFAAINLTGCASQSLGSKSETLYQKVVTAHQNMLGRQSYAYDFNVNLQRPPANLTSQLEPTPNRDKLVKTLIADNHLDAEQQRLIQQGSFYQHYDDVNPFKVLGIFGSRFSFAAQGVMDLGHGQFSVVPQINYTQHNAQSYTKLPIAADLLKSKAYVDMSMLSEIVTNPKYDGRYVELDYGKLLRDKKINPKPLLNIIKDISLLTPTMAKESDYQTLPLTTADKQKGITQKINYRTNYQAAIANYLLYFYLNSEYFKHVFDDVRQEANMDVSTPKTFITDILNKTKPATADDQAFEAATRLYNAIETAQSNALQHNEDCGCETTTPIADEAEKVATAAATSANAITEDEHNDEDPSNSDSMVQDNEITADSNDGESNEENERQNSANQVTLALKAFDKYKSKEYTSVAKLATIATENEDAMAKLHLAVVAQSKGFMNSDDTSTTQYGFNQNNQLVNITSLSPLPNIDKVKLGGEHLVNAAPSQMTNSQPRTYIQSVMNFYDYGKARVNPAIFANAVTLKEATKEDSLFAVIKKKDEFDSEKNLDSLARSLFAQGKNYFETFETVYSYHYLLEKSEIDLKDVDMATLKSEAHDAAIQNARENDSLLARELKGNDETDQASTVFSDTVEGITTDPVRKAVNDAYRQRENFARIKTWQSQGLSQAQIFTNLYIQYKQEDDKANPPASAINDTQSVEKSACETLLDSDKLDKKSRKALTRICDNLPKETFEVEPEATQTNVSANEKQFNLLLGEIAVEDMKKQVFEEGYQDSLVKKLEPLIDATYNYNNTAYRNAYQMMLSYQYK